MKIRKEIQKYLKNPDIDKHDFEILAEKIFSFLRVFLNYFLIVFGISIITGILRIAFRIEYIPNDLDDLTFVLINILAFPVLEETAFRLSLVYKRLNLTLSTLLIFYYSISILLAGSVIDISNEIILRVGLSVFVAILVYLILGIKTVGTRVNHFWNKHRKIVLYTLLLFFTFRHLDFYALKPVVLILSPILLLPQFVGGIFLSFTRIRFGFIYAILLHTMINILAFAPRLISHYAN